MQYDGQRPQRVEPGQQRGRRRQHGEHHEEPQGGQGQFHQRADRPELGARQQQGERGDRPQAEDGRDRLEQPGQTARQPAVVRDAPGAGRGISARGDMAADQEEHGEGLEQPGDGRQPGHVPERARRAQGAAVGDQGRDQPVAEDDAEHRDGAQGVHGPVPVCRGGRTDAVGATEHRMPYTSYADVSHGSPPWSRPGRSGPGWSERSSRA